MPIMGEPGDLFVGFNSKGALASVDHLHFHIGTVKNLLQEDAQSVIYAVKASEDAVKLFENADFSILKARRDYEWIKFELKESLSSSS